MAQKITNQNKCGASTTASFKAAKFVKSFLTITMLVLSITAVHKRSYAQGGTWTLLTTNAPDFNGGVMLLLTDGTVLAKTYTGSTFGNVWDKLTPDVHGSYINGTWSTTPAMHDDRLYFSTQVLKDGRVYVAGGEDGSGANKCEIYNPVTNTWSTPLTVPGGYSIDDGNSEILPDGRVLQAIVSGGAYHVEIYDPVANTYSAAPDVIGSHDESAWLKLPDNSILFVDIFSTTSERYIPSTNTWVSDGDVPVALYDAFNYESGAAFMLPNGKAFFIGSTSNTAIYTPSGTTAPGTWIAGPAIPAGLGAPDASAAMMVNGKVLCAFSRTPTFAGDYSDSTMFYEYDYTTNAFTLVGAPGGGNIVHNQTYMTNMLDLPDGTVLFADQGSKQYYEYTPAGTALTSGKPTVSNASRTNCDTFLITGTLFTGISEGANFGDDWQMSSNYPIIRLTSGTNVYYARSFNWNRIGAVMTGTLPDTARFVLPSGLPAGTYSLAVVVNGNASTPYSFNPGYAISPSNASVAIGGNMTLTDPMTGGVWSSSSTTVAAIGSGSGIITGVTAGSATITYSSTGCTTTSTVAVTGGTTPVCIGSTVVISDLTTGGTWTSNNTSVATVSGSGVVTGVSAGTASIVHAPPTGSSSTYNVIVNMAPPSITGASTVCQGGTLSLSDAATGGTWSSANTTITINSSTGLISGISAGSAAITYSLGSCAATKTLTINPVAAIAGGSSICLGSSITLTDAISGGTWSSSNTSIANISAAGVTSGLASGSSVISYILPTGCSVTSLVLVNPTPAPIATSTNICVGSAIALTTTPSGGSWASSTPALATVTPSTGVVTGLASGTAIITYSISSGCITTTSIVVNSVPAAISGPLSVCTGASVTLTESGAGSWTSSNTSIATINSSGSVTGVSPGVDTIAYVLSSGCTASSVVTVNAVPGAISGTTVLCKGTTSTFSDGVAGGTWSSGNPGIASVDPGTGVVTGSSAGTATIYYSIGTCSVSATVTINPSPATITGAASTCTGLTTTLSDATTGGIWNSSNTAIVSIDPTTGIVTGISSGTASVSYTLTAGCMLSRTETINDIPSGISGAAATCAGATIALSDGIGGGTWSSSNTAIANVVSATGIVTGISAGTATINYSIGTCSASTIVTINTAPSAITGTATVCVGATTTLSESISGGAWSSSNAAIANVVSGVVTGASAGTATILYAIGGSCTVSTIVTVNTVPVTIGGTANVCTGATTTLTDGTAGGTWSSNNTAVAGIISTTGVATGVASGTATIYYTTSGCNTSVIVTVSPLPATITGTATVCGGATTTLTDGTTGGVWASSNTTKATVSGGIVTGAIAGTTTISYTTGLGCSVSQIVTVNATPVTIGGTATVCVGTTTTLNDASANGTWSSSNTSIATVVPTTGVAGGVATGTATISYALSTGCSASAVVMVNAAPVAISGTATVCVGATTTLSDGTSGGTWSSSNTAIANVTGGTVTGVSSGTAIISYTTPGGCVVSKIITVNATPAAIGGTASACVGATTTLTDGTGSGTWSSSNTSIASIVSTTGVARGVASGTASISYSLSTGCRAIKVMTVNTVPVAISGSATVCTGTATTLTDGTAGGTWVSSNTAKFTVSGGVVSGVAAGAATVSYSLSGCVVTKAITVYASPASITGTTTICTGSTSTLADGTASGTWTSSNNALATVASSTGRVKGVAAGTPTITYKLSTGCIATKVVTIHSCAREMANTVCIGSTISLTGDVSGGKWSSSNDMIAKVDEVTGAVTGISAGSVTIAYTVSSEPGSGNDLFSVSVYPVPGPVTLTASPSASIVKGQNVTLTANATANIPQPSYQWLINGNPIAGANSASFANSNFADNDLVACQVTGICGEVPVNNNITIRVAQGVRQIIPAGADIRVLPNPNNGSFVLKGLLGNTNDEEVTIEITDMLGRVIYTEHVLAQNGNIDERIQLKNTIANGAYILSLQSASTNAVLHIIVGQ